ncbi:MAG: hypothetical protein OEY14_10935 [Myxococcales bacterium]|nr:hypothetical protein [Myxococcales bacterium]
MRERARRWIFVGMALALSLPIVWPRELQVEPSPRTRAFHARIAALPKRSRVLLSIDYDPVAHPELDPFARALLRHLQRRQARLVFITLHRLALPNVEALVAELALSSPDALEGQDYASLGFKEGAEIAIAAMGQSFSRVWGRDARGRSTDALPILRGVRTLADFDQVIALGGSYPGPREYVEQVVTRHQLPFLAATTSMELPELLPYYPGQIQGLVGGTRGAAEYEALIGRPAEATRLLGAIDIGEAYLVSLLLLAMLLGILERRRRQPPAGSGSPSEPG